MKAHLFITVLLLSWPASSRAQQTRVAVVTLNDESLPLAQRLEAELSSLSYVPATTTCEVTEPGESEIVEIGSELDCAVILVVRPGRDAIDIWTVEAGEGRAAQRGTVSDTGEQPSISSLAIRSAEHLRALLLEVAPAPPPQAPQESSEPQLATPRETPEPSLAAAQENSEPSHPVPREETEPTGAAPREDTEPTQTTTGDSVAPPRPEWVRRHLELGLGVGVLWSPGGVGASGQAIVELAFVPRRWLGVHLMGVAPMVRAMVSGPEGEAKIWPGMFGGGLRVRVTSVSRRVGGAFDIGIAAAVLGMSGEANPPYTSQADRVWAAAPYLRPRLVVRLLDRLQLGVDVLIGVAAPQPVVRFAARDAASWGQPFIVAGVTFAGLLM